MSSKESVKILNVAWNKQNTWLKNKKVQLSW